LSYRLNKAEYKELLEDVCSGYCENDHYCILKEFLISSHPDPRILMQLRAIDRYKYEKSKEKEKDIGWEGAFRSWIDEGYAVKFGEIYKEGIKFKELLAKLFA